MLELKVWEFFFFKQESMGVLIYIKLVIYSIFYLISYLDFNKGTNKVSLQQNFKFMMFLVVFRKCHLIS